MCSKYKNELEKELAKLESDRRGLEDKISGNYTQLIDQNQRLNELNIKIAQKRSRLQHLGKPRVIEPIHIPSGTRLSN